MLTKASFNQYLAQPIITSNNIYPVEFPLELKKGRKKERQRKEEEKVPAWDDRKTNKNKNNHYICDHFRYILYDG